MDASKLVSASVHLPGTDDPNVASLDVVLGKGGSGGGNALVHVHPLTEQRFLITSGRIKVVFDGRPQRASAHSRLWPAPSRHFAALRNLVAIGA